VRNLSIGPWRAFADLNLADARTTQFRSMHDCFSGETYNVNPAALLCKGEEMGWFEHGSTVIVPVPRGFTVFDGLRDGARIRVGQAILTMR